MSGTSPIDATSGTFYSSSLGTETATCVGSMKQVGSERFVEQVKTELGSAVGRRQIAAENKTYTLREPSPPYNHLFDGNNRVLSQNNAYLWDTILDSTDT